MAAWICPSCQHVNRQSVFAISTTLICSECGSQTALQLQDEPTPPPVQTQAHETRTDPAAKSPLEHEKIVFDGFEMPVCEDKTGRKWCYFPRPFRLREELNDWLHRHGAYMFDQNHYVVDDPLSTFCLYIQVDVTKDGRHSLCFLSHRDHWPVNVPIHAQRMKSTAQQQQQQKDMLMTVGAAFFAAAMLKPRTSHIYHHRSR